MNQVSRNRVLLFALVFGVAAAVLAYVYLSKQAKLSKAVAPAVYAKSNIPNGTIIQPDMLELRVIPKESLPPETLSSIELAAGKVATSNIRAGEPVSTGRVTLANRLASVVKPYMRAVTVAVDPVVGVGGMLKPGDRVDVISTFIANGGSVTKTVLQNVELIAIGPNYIEDNANKTKIGSKDQPASGTTATLAVMPFDAEKLVLADARGEIRLSLRRSDDTSLVASKGVTGRAVMGIVPPDAPEKAQKTAEPAKSEAPLQPQKSAPAPKMADIRPFFPTSDEPLLKPQLVPPLKIGPTLPVKPEPTTEATVQIVRGTNIEDVTVPE